MEKRYFTDRHSFDRAQRYIDSHNEAVRKAGGIFNYFKGAAAIAQRDTKKGETAHDANGRR